jgi:hypothetical protein
MRVLVACEFTGKTRDAFARLGHDAWSCDLLPSEKTGNHYQGDVRDMLSEHWDLMIAHPPCTYLSRAANRVWNAPGRAELREEAFAFFMQLVNAHVAKICIENPVGYANSAYRKPDQIIHPYYFGERQLKRTCLWLKGLPKLWYWPVDDLFGKRTMTEYPEPLYVHERAPSKNYKGGEVKKRYFTDAKAIVNGNKVTEAHERSRTFDGIAQAMARQWSTSLPTLLAVDESHALSNMQVSD